MNKTFVWVFFLIVAASSASASLNDGLGSYWYLDNGVFTDVMGAYNFTDAGTVNATGRINSSRDFDTQTDSIQEGTTFFDSPPTAWTLSMWINFDSCAGHAGGDYLFYKWRYTAPPDNRVGAYINNANCEVYYAIRNSGTETGITGYANTTVTNTGEWHHYVFIQNSSYGSRLYINGQNVANSTATNAKTVPTFASSIAFQLGTLDAITSYPTYAYAFDGKMDEVGYWTRELTQAEIVSIYNGGSGCRSSDACWGSLTYSLRGLTKYNNTIISNVSVQLTNMNTNATQYVNSNSTGGYYFPSLTSQTIYLVTAWLKNTTGYRPLSHYVNVTVAD